MGPQPMQITDTAKINDHESNKLYQKRFEIFFFRQIDMQCLQRSEPPQKLSRALSRKKETLLGTTAGCETILPATNEAGASQTSTLRCGPVEYQTRADQFPSCADAGSTETERANQTLYEAFGPTSSEES